MILVEPHVDDRQRIRARIFHWREVVGEQRDLRRRVVILAKKLEGFALGSFLPTVEFAEVKHAPLDDAITRAALAFDDTPVSVFFAILEPF